MSIATDVKYTVSELREGSLRAVCVEGIRGLDLSKTFDCGQCFRFEPVANSRHECEWGGIAYGKAVSFASDGGKLYIYNSDERDFENIWYRYLGLDTDYGKIAGDILSRSDSRALSEAVEYGSGIRILRQEKWETLCSFIISQNNNIPRIKKLISSMSQKLGCQLDMSLMAAHGAFSDVGYAFPGPLAVVEAGQGVLSDLKTGFRAKYIYDAAQRVVEGRLDLSAVEILSDTAKASEMLCEIKGVGPKVAACTLLFGFGRLDSFPVDVWIKRAIEKYFPGEFNASALGPYAGVAQQYLFYYERYLGGENSDV